MSVLDLDQFAALPLWGQVLIAARMLQRMLLASAQELPESERLKIDAAIQSIAESALRGGRVREAEGGFASLYARERPTPLVEASRQLFSAAGAAEGALDFPVDASVTRSCREALRLLATDERLLPIQIAVLLGSDIDLVRHACREFRVGRYDGLGKDVLQRLTPLHALTLADRPSIVDEYR